VLTDLNLEAALLSYNPLLNRLSVVWTCIKGTRDGDDGDGTRSRDVMYWPVAVDCRGAPLSCI
jgi:hypothetical protein